MKKVDIEKTYELLKDLKYNLFTPEFVSDEEAEMLYRTIRFLMGSHYDIKILLGHWFSALEDEGVDPWMLKESADMANKYGYTKDDYQKYLNTIA